MQVIYIKKTSFYMLNMKTIKEISCITQYKKGACYHNTHHKLKQIKIIVTKSKTHTLFGYNS